jgi:hypothetical protein
MSNFEHGRWVLELTITKMLHFAALGMAASIAQIQSYSQVMNSKNNIWKWQGLKTIN